MVAPDLRSQPIHIQPKPDQVELYNRQYLTYQKTAQMLRTIHE